MASGALRLASLLSLTVPPLASLMLHLQLPACLRRLTNLDALHIIDSPCGTGPAIKTSMLQCELQPLTQLTQLALELVPAVPSAVAGMARLERFGCNPPAKARIVLPVGSQWLGGLRDLALPAATLADLLQVLSGATRLESLVCGGLFAEHVTTQARVLNWAGAHPSLRRLTLDRLGDHFCEESCKLVSAVLACSPALSISFPSNKVLAYARNSVLANLWEAA